MNSKRVETKVAHMDTKTLFSKRVLRLVAGIPRGRVATYGLIAKLAGKPHGSRGVGWLLHSSSRKYRLPWQRVINSKGKISHPEDSLEHARQMTLLRREGVVFEHGRVDLKKFLWNKK